MRPLIIIGISVIILEIGSYFFEPPFSITVEYLNVGDVLNFRTSKGETLSDGTVILEKIPDNGLYVRTLKGTRLRKNVRAILRNHYFGVPEIEIITNSLGFRHKKLDKKAVNECRLLVLGDSITFGDWMPNELTYPSKIEFYLKFNNKEKKTAKNFEVINAGIGSIDLHNEFEILKETGLSVEPDIVIVGLYLNDAFGSPTLKMLQPPLVLKKSNFIKVFWDSINKIRAIYHSHKWEISQEKIMGYEREKFIQLNQITGNARPGSRLWLNKEIYKNFSDWGYAWSEGYWDRVIPIIELMQKTSEQNNFQLIIVFFPVAQQVYSSFYKNEPQKRFTTEMEKRGILHLDMLPLLREKFRKDHIQLFFDHCHYNEAGNDFIGKKISVLLKDNLFQN